LSSVATHVAEARKSRRGFRVRDSGSQPHAQHR
jgi:hypothetical protein